MNLYILRHAIAVERGTRRYKDDSQRPLTGKGAKKMHSIAQGMLKLNLSFSVILSSPFIRAKQTAGIVADVFHAKKKLKYTPHLGVGGDLKKLILFINGQDFSDSDIMLVGHEPYLSCLISMLIAGTGNVSIPMKKGGLCKLNANELRFGKCANLEWLLVPSQLIRLAAPA